MRTADEIPLVEGRMKLLNGVGYIYRLKDRTWTKDTPESWVTCISEDQITRARESKRQDIYEFDEVDGFRYRRKIDTFDRTSNGEYISGKNWIKALEILIS